MTYSVVPYDPVRHQKLKGHDVRTREINRALNEFGEKNVEVFVAVNDKGSVAAAIALFLSKHIVPKTCFVQHLGSLEKGLGTTLIKTAIQFAKKSRMEQIKLTAYPSAAQFYVKMGFNRAPKYPDGTTSNIFTMEIP